jgi:hypothetical protein
MFQLRLQPLVGAALLVSVAGCEDNKSKPTKPSPRPEAAQAPAAVPDAASTPQLIRRPAVQGPVGSIHGVVKFAGNVPPARTRRSPKDKPDPQCAGLEDESLVVGNGGVLRNAVVRVKSDRVVQWVPESPVAVEVVDCSYRPRAQGGVVGQKLTVENRDRVDRVVQLKSRSFFPGGQEAVVSKEVLAAGSPVFERAIDKWEVLALRSDEQPWMEGFILVGTTPHFGTSDDKGLFVIDDVPVGEHQLEGWHEVLGRASMLVRVVEDKPAKVELVFRGKVRRKR